MTQTNVLVHFISSTRRRTPSIQPEMESDLHAYLGGIIRELGGVALSINGMPDHVHVLVRMPSTCSIADIARLIKTNSSRWAHERWPQWKAFGWQLGYGAFSVSESGANAMQEYIARQREHHHKRSFEDEYRAFIKKNKIVVDEKHLFR